MKPFEGRTVRLPSIIPTACGGSFALLVFGEPTDSTTLVRG